MRISVVIPARNEERWLPLCLDSLTKQSRAPDEIIVVDNGSTDDTKGVARAYGCTVLSEPVPGVGRARYTGCKSASSDIIAVTDADTRVPADWTAKILGVFEKQPKCVGVTGPWRLFDGGLIAQWSTALQAQAFLRAVALVAPATVNMVGCNAAFRAEAYDRVGGFRPDLKRGEDLNLSLRLRSVGQVRYLPGLTVSTSGRRFQRSFLGGMGQYLPDASRQVAWYLLGRREAARPALGPSPSAMKSAAGAAWTASDDNFFLEMGLALDAMQGMQPDGRRIPALAGYAGSPVPMYELGEEF